VLLKWCEQLLADRDELARRLAKRRRCAARPATRKWSRTLSEASRWPPSSTTGSPKIAAMFTVILRFDEAGACPVIVENDRGQP
jgi:hypothetical protein